MSSEHTNDLSLIVKEITEIKTMQKSDRERIGEIRDIAAPIHKLVANVEHLVIQMREQNLRTDKVVDMYDARMSKQGKRIGDVEKDAEGRNVMVNKHQKRIEDLESDVEEIKTKGSKRLDGFIEKIALVIIGAVIATLLYNIGFSF